MHAFSFSISISHVNFSIFGLVSDLSCFSTRAYLLRITQVATYVILDTRTPFFSQKRAFLRKTSRLPCHFRPEAAQANGFLCYK